MFQFPFVITNIIVDIPESRLTRYRNDPTTSGAWSAGETTLRLRVVIQPEQGIVRDLNTQAVIPLEVVRQDSPNLVAEQSGGDDGVVAGGEVETLVSVDSVGSQTGRILNIST